jgi:hypothetical protein
MEWDDYGESDEFLVKMALDANAPDKDSTSEHVSTFQYKWCSLTKLQKEDEKVEPKAPTKVVYSRIVVEVRCAIKCMSLRPSYTKLSLILYRY